MEFKYKGKTRGTETEIASDDASIMLDYIDNLYGTRDPKEAYQILDDVEKGLGKKIKKILLN